MTIGPTIAAARRARDLRQCDLAAQVFISRRYMALIEQGRRIGSPAVLQAIGRVLNIDLYPLWQQATVKRRRGWVG